MTNCPSCATELELDAVFCGQCGARVRARRQTLTGMDLDGRFHVDAKIAEGGFGTIYRATHLTSKHVVALKVLHSDLAADENLAARFRREGATLSSLSSPHTVSVYEVGETEDGTLYIAMELLRGESLLDRFRSRGPLPWRSVFEIAKAVCRSLGEAHALGIVHRDLKPGNIHLETNDHVKVIDFGIAKLIRGSESDDGDDLTRVGQAVGTLEYMAPEQLIGSACDGRSDIYSLGLVVYEMLTGRRPYADATGPTSLVTALMTQPLIAPSTLNGRGGIPADADKIVLRMLSRELKDRFQTVTEVIDAIDMLLLPLARGSWSTEVDDEATWIDVLPPTLPPAAQVISIITPNTQAAQAAAGHDAVAFGPTHMQVAVSPVTNPGVGPNTPSRAAVGRAPTAPVTPNRALARGSVMPVGATTAPRARRQSDIDGDTPRAEAPREEMPRPKRVTPVKYGGKLAIAPQDFQEPTPPFAVADGSRVRHARISDRLKPTTGSQPLVDFEVEPEQSVAIAPTLPQPTVTRLASAAEKQISTDRTRAVQPPWPAAQPMTAYRIAMWAVFLLVGGAGVGMLIAALAG